MNNYDIAQMSLDTAAENGFVAGEYGKKRVQELCGILDRYMNDQEDDEIAFDVEDDLFVVEILSYLISFDDGASSPFFELIKNAKSFVSVVDGERLSVKIYYDGILKKG